MKYLGRFLLGLVYAAIPIIGWALLYRSFKRIKGDQIAMIQHASGHAELIEQGIYFRPLPGDSFSQTKSKALDYIDFGPLQRLRVHQGQIAYKTVADGSLIPLIPGIHTINLSQNEVFNPATNIHSNQENFIDFGAKKIIRILPGQLGIKTNTQGQYVELEPGVHTINIAEGETFNQATGVQATNQDYFRLGDRSYVTIRNGELGESYNNGELVVLEAGRHTLPTNHIFVRKVPVDRDIIDLGALKIVTVKEGQVAVINTQEGVIVKGAGKHDIKQSEGNFFNSILTTSPQGISLPTLTVMCSDQIEMRAESMLTFKIEDPLKTVGLGIQTIVGFLKLIADGTLRTILSRFSSSDISPSLHTDEDHHSTKRNERLTQLHDECVKALDEKAKEWGLRVTDLQITQILPADEAFLKTLRDLGTQQTTAEVNRRIAENEAQIATIRAKAEESRVVAAKIEQQEALLHAETSAQARTIQANAEALQIITQAKAHAEATILKNNAEAEGVTKLSLAAQDAAPIIHQVMLLKAQAEIIKQAENPVFVQPQIDNTRVLCNTKVYRKNKNGLTFFNTEQDAINPSLVDALNLDATKRLLSAQ